jgi:hypothetical protein
MTYKIGDIVFMQPFGEYAKIDGSKRNGTYSILFIKKPRNDYSIQRLYLVKSTDLHAVSPVMIEILKLDDCYDL